uniref:Uncharacterized protein LOC111114539 n=1 Tax=Crassostrea virginica TaxID=6565 RepID=A0A8B8BYX8_CRAVI|nr:uncharacterized protein LOC111114539 [Crassostrea virginica]XP_022308594.1 uncharacterized protein LOC111114539 [Crassostrea virginica]
MAAYQSSQIVMTLQKISESVYMGLCLKIGTPQQVVIRRDLVDIKELLEHEVARTDDFVKMTSGSQREGFRLEGSDMDCMYWPNNHRVLWDFSHATMYNTQSHILILCDSSESPPGFTLLWLPMELANDVVLSACVRMNGALYISSAKYRGDIMRNIGLPDSIVHGPCTSGTICTMEYDHADCFVSDFWPPSASSWIDRCHSWPPSHVVNEIIRSGCHFVPIGHKLGNNADNEWRISFSQAEQKLVYAMNHTQFLTYGLLKLFVKEINSGLSENEKLLCSYHMKTAIFWTIQRNTMAHWCPQQLLAGFWACFKLLLKWVYEGFCPNFFIPENNMFLNKIYGAAQRNLFGKLYGLYEKGIAFLLQSPSISSYIIAVLCNPRLSICTDEHSMISEVVLDTELFTEINITDTLPNFHNLHSCMVRLQVVQQLISSPLPQYQITMLQKLTANILQTSAFLLHKMYTSTSGANKHMYIADKRSCYMLKLAAKFGFVSDLLYIALYYCKTFRHREALSIIEMTKVKLAQPGVMYCGHVNPERYTEAFGGQSWSTKIRQAVAFVIELENHICYINELTSEQQSALENQRASLLIPPFVLLHMLEFLCCRHVNQMRAQAALDDLQVVVHHDQGVLIPEPYRDISWEILGICQQMTGNHQAALYSYHQSLTQYPSHKIHNATRNRIQDLHLP